MKPLLFLTNRLVKIFANSTKILCYVFHFFFPSKRFTIPKNAKPLFTPGQHKRIPAILWQTNFSNRVTLPIYLNYLFNRLLTPTCEYRFMDNEDCLQFVKENYPEDIQKGYCKLRIGAAKADFWRLLVLQKIGGIYLDVDAHLTWPVYSIIKSQDDEMYVMTRHNHYTNYFLASKEDNPNLKKMIEIVLNNINEGRSKSVYELTGPANVDKALENKHVNYLYHQHICAQGSFTDEHFQYLDKPRGKWTHAKQEDLLQP